MVRIIPAIPGSVNTAPNPARIPKINMILTTKATSAKAPALP